MKTFRSDFPPSNCIDGNPSTFCHYDNAASGSDTDPWLSIDLGASQDVSLVTIYNRADVCCQDRLSNFEIWVGASQGSHVAPATMCASPTAADEVGPFVISCAAVGRFVTIVLPGSGRELNLGEVQVFRNVLV